MPGIYWVYTWSLYISILVTGPAPDLRWCFPYWWPVLRCISVYIGDRSCCDVYQYIDDLSLRWSHWNTGPCSDGPSWWSERACASDQVRLGNTEFLLQDFWTSWSSGLFDLLMYASTWHVQMPINQWILKMTSMHNNTSNIRINSIYQIIQSELNRSNQ